jgi:hypothetical protein
MKHATGIGRLAGLAVGLGIGAALAATPGTALADPASPIDANDVAGASSAAVGAQPDLPSFDPSNLAISVDGISNGGAFSVGDFAYAQGNAIADAAGGSFDNATAVGNGAGSYAFGDFDTATVTGDDAEAKAVAGFFEVASVVQTGSTYDEAVAAGPGLGVFGAFNDAYIDGTGSTATATVLPSEPLTSPRSWATTAPPPRVTPAISTSPPQRATCSTRWPAAATSSATSCREFGVRCCSSIDLPAKL